jgi:hypothetical protein
VLVFLTVTKFATFTGAINLTGTETMIAFTNTGFRNTIHPHRNTTHRTVQQHTRTRDRFSAGCGQFTIHHADRWQVHHHTQITHPLHRRFGEE